MPFEFTNNKSMHEIEMHEKTENARKTHFVVTFVVMNFSFLKETRFVGPYGPLLARSGYPGQVASFYNNQMVMISATVNAPTLL